MAIDAHFGDGRSARRHPVTLSYGEARLWLRGAQVDTSYPRAAIRLSEPFAHAAAIAYFDDGAHCEIGAADYPALAAMLGRRATLVERWQRHWRVAIASIVLLVAVVGAGALWGVPLAASAVTAMLPIEADLRIGALTRSTAAAQGLFQPSTLNRAQQDDIARAWRAVQPAHARLPLTLLVRAMPAPFGPNAMALPDGTVILNDAMVRKILGPAARFDARQFAALAGVLAHEIGHVEHRHGMQGVVRATLSTALAAYLFGDFSAVAAGAPAVLLSAHHSRAMEAEADADALATLRARHLPAAPLADLLLAMDPKPAGHAPGWLGRAAGYLSSHPGGAERASVLRAAR